MTHSWRLFLILPFLWQSGRDSTTLPTPILPTPVLPTKDPDVSFRLLICAILTAMKELIQRIYAPIGVNRLWSRGSAVGSKSCRSVVRIPLQ